MNNRWGLSTGLAFAGKTLPEAVREAVNLGAKVVELCPKEEGVSEEEKEELRILKKEKEIAYRIHFPDQPRLEDGRGNLKFARERWAKICREVFPLAQDLGAEAVIFHPLLTSLKEARKKDPYSLLDQRALRTQILDLVRERPVRVLIETGVVRRRLEDPKIIGVEQGRNPYALLVDFVKGGLDGVVLDVAKASRSRQTLEENRKNPDDLEFAIKALFPYLDEVHLVGVSFWPEHEEMNRLAMEGVHRHRPKGVTYIIECQPERRERMVATVKEQLRRWEVEQEIKEGKRELSRA